MKLTEEEKFKHYLEEEGLKFTPERELILQEVFSIHDHFEADDLIIGLRSKGRRVSRASVYRTLPLLVKSGLLRDVYSAEKHSHYEHTFGHGHHDHLICSECGRLIEFHDDKLEALQERVCSKFDFSPATHKLEIVGVCSDCRKRA